ncbi:hypothetical protein H9P43_009180 [Blastocladiella emersonii ATCC 22665]|nr:hypothetical protein H9P43_009180 [Blastocladiella emersonii ATCC 22665]
MTELSPPASAGATAAVTSQPVTSQPVVTQLPDTPLALGPAPAPPGGPYSAVIHPALPHLHRPTAVPDLARSATLLPHEPCALVQAPDGGAAPRLVHAALRKILPHAIENTTRVRIWIAHDADHVVRLHVFRRGLLLPGEGACAPADGGNDDDDDREPPPPYATIARGGPATLARSTSAAAIPVASVWTRAAATATLYRSADGGVPDGSVRLGVVAFRLDKDRDDGLAIDDAAPAPAYGEDPPCPVHVVRPDDLLPLRKWVRRVVGGIPEPEEGGPAPQPGYHRHRPHSSSSSCSSCCLDCCCGGRSGTACTIWDCLLCVDCCIHLPNCLLGCFAIFAQLCEFTGDCITGFCAVCGACAECGACDCGGFV